MIVEVPLYGVVHIPRRLEPILDTATFRRLQGISMDSMPANWMEYPIANLWEHSLGTLRVAQQVEGGNVLRKDQRMKFLVSSLLHDAGNPCFHHLAEGFLKMRNGHNGESFLRVLLGKDPELCAILKSLGVSVESLLNMVTGAERPFSEILHGSMDVDNLDNVVRYWCRMGGTHPPFPPLAIANNLQWVEGRWAIRRSAVPYAQCWQNMRRSLYRNFIYGEPHLASVIMLFRAVALAYYAGDIPDEFYFLDDVSAADFLVARNKESARLIQMAARRIRYTLALEQEEPPGGAMERLCKMPDSRNFIADAVSKDLRCRPADVATYIGKGRDYRPITLPVLEENEELTSFPNGENTSCYRIKIYLHPDISRSKADKLPLLVKSLLQ